MGFAALLSLLSVFAGALSVRFGLLPFGISFTTFGLGLIACAILAMTAGALIARRLARKQRVGKLPLWLILCLLPVVLVVKQIGLAGFQAPPIHDISTDLSQPPVFVFAQAEREPGENSLEHGGEALAQQQRAGYPQLAPLPLSASKAEIWTALKTVISANNWRVLGEDESRGHIEAVITTRLMGFADDIVIRLRAQRVAAKAAADSPDNHKSAVVESFVVDVRSVSRVGVSDLGANAARIERFLTALQNQLKD